jgi:hypothetical protein
MVGRHSLQPPWELHSRQHGRNNADHPVADINNDHRAGCQRTNQDSTSYDSNNRYGRASDDHRTGYHQVVTDTNTDVDAYDSITDTDPDHSITDTDS